MTEPNVVSLKAITPPRWEGEVTDYMLEMIVKGLIRPHDAEAMNCRLAHELRELRKKAASHEWYP